MQHIKFVIFIMVTLCYLDMGQAYFKDKCNDELAQCAQKCLSEANGGSEDDNGNIDFGLTNRRFASKKEEKAYRNFQKMRTPLG